MCKRLIHLAVVALVLCVSSPAMADLIVAEELLVDLRAEDLAYGVVTGTWTNHGTLDDFTPVGAPLVEDVDGRKCITFDGSSYFEGPESTPGIHGNGTRSIEIWAYNGTDLVGEETMISWSRRGGGDGTNIAFNYGNNETWGAVGHWGSPDMAWSGDHAPAPAPENWWHLVYTYDGTSMRLYVNGEANTTEDFELNTHGPHIIRVAAQANDTGAAADTGFNFTGSIAEVRIHDGVLSPADVAYNFRYIPPYAKKPIPADGQTDVAQDVILSWVPGPSAATRDVYFGTSLEDVTNADRANPLGVLVSQDQVPTSYKPEGLLDFEQTYYWRVDEVNVAPDNTIFPGTVWSFTVEPLAYAIENIIATSNALSEPGVEPDNTINGSGLNELDEHSADDNDMWAGALPTEELPYIQYEFDRVYKLYEMLVWNYNVTFEPLIGFGFKDVTIEISEDGADWTVLKDVVFAQAPAREGYQANTLVDLEGATAKYLRLTANTVYGSSGKCGLSEVRILHTPVVAREPIPADGAADVSVDTLLDWRGGRDAEVHEVRLGTDPNAMDLVDTVSETLYSPGGLDVGTSYYWRIDEINDAETVGVWEGDLWSFTTEHYLVIDDFEDYTDDEGSLIYESWLDGYGIPTNGSQVGYLEAPFAERTVVHSGRQAMPMFYENAGSAAISEAELTLDPAQDWARAAITTLVVHIHGDLTNDVAQVYVKINGTKVADLGVSTTMPLWKAVAIDLAAAGVDLSGVTTLTIGIEGSGSGVLYVDDVRLYGQTLTIIEPVDPGTESLALHYAFEGDVTDSSGNGYHGTSADNPFFEAAPGDLGQAMFFDGIDDHVDMPIGALISTLSDITMVVWINFPGEGGDWQRVIDIGNGEADGYMFVCPSTAASGPVRLAITPTNWADESVVETPNLLPTGWHHIAAVVDSASMTLRLYVDGALLGESATTMLPKDLGETTQNWLGRSQYAADAYFDGLLADVQIYTRALSTGEIRYLVGDR